MSSTTNIPYSEEKVRKVCELMSEGKYSFKEIAEMTELPQWIISRIYNGRSHAKISKEYDLKKIKRKNLSQRKYPPKVIEKICFMIQERKYSLGQIARETGVNVNIVNSIRQGKSYRDISSKYGITEMHTLRSNPEKIRKACLLLRNPENSYYFIMKKTGLTYHTIERIALRETNTDISCKFRFPEDKGIGRKTKRRVHDISIIEKACEMLEDPSYSFTDISKETGLSSPTISRLFHKKAYPEVAKNYNFEKREEAYKHVHYAFHKK